MNNNFVAFILLMVLTFILSACSNNDSKSEVQKLLEKQTEVTNEKKISPETFNNNVLNDSLERGQIKLLEKKKIAEKDLHPFQVEKYKMNDAIEKQKHDNLKKHISEMENSLESINNDLNDVKNKDGELTKKKEKILVKEEQLTEQELIAKDILVTGISFIDSSLIELERQNIMKQKELDLIEQKIILSHKKIDLLEDEKSICYRKKNEIIKNNKDDDALTEYDQKLEEINLSLLEEASKLKKSEKEKEKQNSWLKDANNLSRELRIMLEKEYEKNKSIEKFIKSEMEKLYIEKETLHENVSEIESTKTQLEEKQADISDKLAIINDKKKISESTELSDELLKKKNIDSLKDKQKAILENNAKVDKKQENDNSDIGNIKNEAKKLPKELKNEQLENENFKPMKLNPFARTFIIIALLGTIFIMVLYSVGKRKREKK